MAEPAARTASASNPESGEHPIARDRRSASRVTTELTVLVEAYGQNIVGIATDLGLGGTFVCSIETLPYGTDVDVRFGGPEVGLELCIPGTVRWTTELGFGVQFGALGARETRALILFCTAARTL
jgi:hypothetical protein